MNQEHQILIDSFISDTQYARIKSINTQLAYKSDLKKLAQHLEAKSKSLIKLRSNDLNLYLKSRIQAGHSTRSCNRILASCRQFYQWLVITEKSLNDPTLNFKNPKISKPLPVEITEEEINCLLQMPDTQSKLGIRDQAMLEILYGSGLRLSELINLKMDNLHLEKLTLQVTSSTGSERLVPMTSVSQKAIALYLEHVRWTLLDGRKTEYVFISQQGQKMTRQTFWYRIKRYAQYAGIEAKVSPKSLRHAFAEHLLKHGADIGVVQQLLGHSEVGTTMVYKER